MKVAAIQFAPVFGNKAENIRRMARLVVQAARDGAQLIVLPELAATGYSFMSYEEAEPHAEMVDKLRGYEDGPVDMSSTLSVFPALARKLKVVLVWGFMRKDSGTGLLHNSQAYIDPGGYFTMYDKINSFGNDFLWMTEGRSNPPVIQNAGPFRQGTGRAHSAKDYETKNIGLLICRDIRDKKDDVWTKFYQPGDADIVCFSANWGEGGFPSVTWMDFVRDNKVTLIVSNRYGQESHNNFGKGGICIIRPSGQVETKGLVWGQDCIVHADV